MSKIFIFDKKTFYNDTMKRNSPYTKEELDKMTWIKELDGMCIAPMEDNSNLGINVTTGYMVHLDSCIEKEV